MKTTVFRLGLALIMLLLSGTLLQGQQIEYLNTVLQVGVETVTVGDLLLEEPFESEEAWQVSPDADQTLMIIDEQYRIINGAALGFARGLNDQPHTDVVIQVDVEPLAITEEDVYGLMCRADSRDTGEGYYFLVDGGGAFAIVAFYEGNLEVLVDWTESRAIRAAPVSNTFIVVCAENYLAFYANGRLLGETHDSAISAGVTGLVASANKDAPVDIAFDNLRIWEAQLAEPVATGEPPQTLTHYDAEWPDMIEKLQDYGVIGSGGSLVFVEDHAYFQGQGYWFTALAWNRPFADIVMAGELTFSVGKADSFELCELMARIRLDAQGNAVTFVTVGFDNSGYLVIVDRFSEYESPNFDASLRRFALDEPHHVLFLLQDNLATVYVDGSLTIREFEVADRSGIYGIGLIAEGALARCDGRDIWVYQVPTFRPGICEVGSGTTINRRSGPGTNYASPGPLEAGAMMQVTGQTTGADGFIWWQLVDGSWVRDDIVYQVGSCEDIPEVNP